MPRVMILALTLAGVSALPSPATEIESPVAYEIVISAAVPVLPEAIRPFFECHIEAFRQGALPAAVRTAPPNTIAGNPQSHYVMLDVEAKTPDVRHQAALQFPRDRSAARRLFRQSGVGEGGLLPWALEEQYRVLAQAFEAGDLEAVPREAGLLLHLATDSSMPFNTTINHESGSARRRPLDAALVSQLQERLDYEVRVWPGRFDPIEDPLEAAFAALLEAHKALEPLMRIDEQVSARLTRAKVQEPGLFLDAYFEAVMVQSGPIMEARLEGAALLGANLIGGAWAKAGCPMLKASSERAVESGQNVSPASLKPGFFVGSRNSTIFHTPTCSHALRIKPENLVRFGSVEEARAAGRKPCQACRPDEE